MNRIENLQTILMAGCGTISFALFHLKFNSLAFEAISWSTVLLPVIFGILMAGVLEIVKHKSK